jgi:hypothetical protein
MLHASPGSPIWLVDQLCLLVLMINGACLFKFLMLQLVQKLLHEKVARVSKQNLSALLVRNDYS